MSKWRAITTIPKNQLVLVGVWIQHDQAPEPHFEYYVAMWNFDSNTMVDQAWGSMPFDDPFDYDCWMLLPDPYKKKEEAKGE